MSIGQNTSFAIITSLDLCKCSTVYELLPLQPSQGDSSFASNLPTHNGRWLGKSALWLKCQCKIDFTLP